MKYDFFYCLNCYIKIDLHESFKRLEDDELNFLIKQIIELQKVQERFCELEKKKKNDIIDVKTLSICNHDISQNKTPIFFFNFFENKNLNINNNCKNNDKSNCTFEKKHVEAKFYSEKSLISRNESFIYNLRKLFNNSLSSDNLLFIEKIVHKHRDFFFTSCNRLDFVNKIFIENFNDKNNNIYIKHFKLNLLFKLFSIAHNIKHPLCEYCALSFSQKYKKKSTNDFKINSKNQNHQNLIILENKNINLLKTFENFNCDLERQLIFLRMKFEEIYSNEMELLFDKINILDFNYYLNQFNFKKNIECNGYYDIFLKNTQKLNILNNIFQINFDEDEKHGSIIGLKLGFNLNYLEFNTALGQIILLVRYLVKKFDIDLENYLIKPFGSQSYIIQILNLKNNKYSDDKEKKERSVLNFFIHKDIMFEKFYYTNKFDISISPLLDILLKIEKKLLVDNNNFKFPYQIIQKNKTIDFKDCNLKSNNSFISNYKFLLENLKYLLSHVNI